MVQPIDCWANYAFPCNPSQMLLTALGLNWLIFILNYLNFYLTLRS